MTQDFEERFKRLEKEVNRDSKTNKNFRWKMPANLSRQSDTQAKSSSVQDWIWLTVSILVVLVLGRMVLGMAFGLAFMLFNLAVFAALVAGVFTLFRLFKK
jgi:membrane protein required for beta-lactamase induction